MNVTATVCDASRIGHPRLREWRQAGCSCGQGQLAQWLLQGHLPFLPPVTPGPQQRDSPGKAAFLPDLEQPSLDAHMSESQNSRCLKKPSGRQAGRIFITRISTVVYTLPDVIQTEQELVIFGVKLGFHAGFLQREKPRPLSSRGCVRHGVWGCARGSLRSSRQ